MNRWYLEDLNAFQPLYNLLRAAIQARINVARAKKFAELHAEKASRWASLIAAEYWSQRLMMALAVAVLALEMAVGMRGYFLLILFILFLILL